MAIPDRKYRMLRSESGCICMQKLYLLPIQFRISLSVLEILWFRITQGKVSSGWPVIASWGLVGSSPLVILVTQCLSYICIVSMVTVASGVCCWYVMCYVRRCWLIGNSNDPLRLKLPKILSGTATDIIGFLSEPSGDASGFSQRFLSETSRRFGCFHFFPILVSIHNDT